jgi:photosystem II stability/assembly factor-like uncharacterized protein
MYLGISAVGVFKTEDAGNTWMLKNKNVRADFLPDKYPEFGQCVHKLLMDPNDPNCLYQQNHCGVYRTEDAGDNWIELSRGLPSDFGFPMATHPRRSGTFFVVPEEGADFRIAANKEFAVYGTWNSGKTWKKLNRGLPGKSSYLGCHREGLATDRLDPAGIYVGTRMGHLFSSINEGKDWKLTAQWLPPIHSVSTATLA